MSDTVLTLQSDPQGGYWLWTVTPWVVTLEQDLVEHTTEPSRLENSLLKYAGALLTGLRYALRRNVMLSLDLANFAAFRGSTYYVGDEIRQGDWPAEIASCLLRPLDRFGDEVPRSFVQELALGIRADLRGTDEGVRLSRELGSVDVSVRAASARDRCLEALA